MPQIERRVGAAPAPPLGPPTEDALSLSLEELFFLERSRLERKIKRLTESNRELSAKNDDLANSQAQLLRKLASGGGAAGSDSAVAAKLKAQLGEMREERDASVRLVLKLGRAFEATGRADEFEELRAD